MNELLLIAGMTLVTFVVRYPMMALFSRIPLPKPVFHALRYVPPAVLAAIIVPAVLMNSSSRIDVSPQNSYLPAAIVAALVAWRTKNLLLTIVVGMAAMWLWRAVMGV
jgi:branched-subunit amino acid transport protein